MDYYRIKKAKADLVAMQMEVAGLEEKLREARKAVRGQKKLITELHRKNRTSRLADLGSMFERENLDETEHAVLYGALADALRELKSLLSDPIQADEFREKGLKEIAAHRKVRRPTGPEPGEESRLADGGDEKSENNNARSPIPPTEAQARLAVQLGQARGVELPQGWDTDHAICGRFIDDYKTREKRKRKNSDL